jgi:hypothetical protein
VALEGVNDAERSGRVGRGSAGFGAVGSGKGANGATKITMNQLGCGGVGLGVAWWGPAR